MGWSYRVKQSKKKSGINASVSSRGVNVSYTINTRFFKYNVPLIGRRKKSRLTAKGSGFFSKYF